MKYYNCKETTARIVIKSYKIYFKKKNKLFMKNHIIRLLTQIYERIIENIKGQIILNKICL